MIFVKNFGGRNSLAGGCVPLSLRYYGFLENKAQQTKLSEILLVFVTPLCVCALSIYACLLIKETTITYIKVSYFGQPQSFGFGGVGGEGWMTSTKLGPISWS